ncbi:MFS transporter [Pelolinea submarina]|uniref:UMF1 family MFS transporter n=1 Tax=Pelolinea submarina TaxID=913107 RepID=A0A347ZV04_9CHLR|nr:MFS transporter [Pelolinea submarina]REG10279.1 UMF1 family MFS transporter [Pelolinea submarina]BBB49135.1 MFS transporter, UMF1 family [Pelolinea submarina]
MGDEIKKRAIRAWTMYDWANSAFATTVMGAILPNYFSLFIAGDNSLTLWGYTVAIGSLIAAVLSPVLGAIADYRGSKKLFLGIFAAIGILSTALMFLIRTPGDWLLACILYIVGTVGFAGSLVFYDALLPHVAEPDEMDMVSSRGYAMGYIGGGLLLLINVAMIFVGPKFLPNMSEADATALMMRLSLASVAIWWAAFSIPLFRDVQEPPRKIEAGEEKFNPVAVGFQRFFKALKDIRKFRDLFMFLLAFFVYANGIGTIITMAVAFGSDLGFSSTILIGTLLMVQFVAAPFAILFGKLPEKLGTKRTIYLSLIIYTLVAIVGYFMTKEWHFLLLGFGVATVQGGSQALSRSLIGKLMPKNKSAEFYGFFSVSEKFNTVIGPAVFSLINQLTGNSHLAIISLIVFFLAGIAILAKVDIERGAEVAQKEDAKMLSVG